MALLTPEIEAMIGSERVYTAPEEVGRAAIRYFALAVGDDNPLYSDPDHARAHGFDDVIAPPTFVAETNQYMTGVPDELGYLGHTWELEVPGTQPVRGGHEYEFHRPLYPGDRITARWRLLDVSEKSGQDGKAMLLVTSEARYENQHGDLIAVNRETLIHREL